MPDLEQIFDADYWRWVDRTTTAVNCTHCAHEIVAYAGSPSGFTHRASPWTGIQCPDRPTMAEPVARIPQ